MSKLKLLMIGGIAAAVGISEADKTMNYTPVDAVVSKSVVDCFVKDGNEQIVKKNSKDLAYMDCEMAPYAAEEFGFQNDDIQKRSTYEFTYVSPIDGSKQKGKHTKTADIKAGQKIKVHAHKEEPGKYRM